MLGMDTGFLLSPPNLLYELVIFFTFILVALTVLLIRNNQLNGNSLILIIKTKVI